MKKKIFLIGVSLLFFANLKASPFQNQLMSLAPSDLEFSQTAFQIVDLKTMRSIAECNRKVRFCPASLIKTFTALAALEILPKDFCFETKLNAYGTCDQTILNGILCFTGSSDPYLTNNEIDQMIAKLEQRGVKEFKGKIQVQQKRPAAAWVGSKGLVEDHENYYAPKIYPLNFNRNRYAISIEQAFTEGESSKIAFVDTLMNDYTFKSFVETGKKGTGDQAYIFKSLENDSYEIRGSIGIDLPRYTIYGRLPNPPKALAQYVQMHYFPNTQIEEIQTNGNTNPIFSYISYSPELSSMLSDMLKRSDNLIAESIGEKLSYKGLTGYKALNAFWHEQGVRGEFDDCSGLSVTSFLSCEDAQTALEFAYRNPEFQNILSMFSSSQVVLDNGKKVSLYYKSGSMNHVANFMGFAIINSEVYSFCFLVNQTKLNKKVIFKWIKDALTFSLS